MSVYVGDLHLNGVPTTIDWSIVCRAPTYSNISGNCRLCLLEKYYIMYESDKATLNVKSEFFASCPNKKKILLKNYARREKCGKDRGLMGLVIIFHFYCYDFCLSILLKIDH